MGNDGASFLEAVEQFQRDLGRLSTDLANLAKGVAAIRAHVRTAMQTLQEEPAAGDTPNHWGGHVGGEYGGGNVSEV